jgi:FKBP-type peptidyl-prolyl cis-trans isomerase FkpA
MRPALIIAAMALIALPACGSTAKTTAGPKPATPAQLKCNAVTTTGLGHQVIKAGTGEKPVFEDTVKVDYIGYFAKSGKVFDSGKGIEFPVSAVVPGFSEGLRLMQPGGKYRLCIPARLGYGARDLGPIPANSDLVFYVQLVSVTKG